MNLTVTLPVHNAMPYLPSAVESVLAQSYQDFRFLIIDDGSSDGSTEYLRSLRDDRVRLLVRENRGLGATLNELFRDSTTENVCRMDADDICGPDRLAKQMAFLQAHPRVVMLGTGIDFVVGERIVPGFCPPVEHEPIRKRLLQKRPGVNHPTLIVKREAWQRVGGYRFSGAGEDLDFCLRLCDAGGAANLPEPLYHYRLRRESLTFKASAVISMGYAYAVACAKARERGAAEPELAAFETSWSRRKLSERIDDRLNTVGLRLYRHSIIHRGEGRMLASGACLLAAAMCLPRTAWSRLGSGRSDKPGPGVAYESGGAR